MTRSSLQTIISCDWFPDGQIPQFVRDIDEPMDTVVNGMVNYASRRTRQLNIGVLAVQLRDSVIDTSEMRPAKPQREVPDRIDATNILTPGRCS